MKFSQHSVYKEVLLPASVLASTIIGAGVFSLPFVFSLAGWGTGILYLVAGAGVFYLVHKMYADIILRSKKKYKFVGYARFYLGETAAGAAVLATGLGAILTLTVYLILGARFLNIIFPSLPESAGWWIGWVLGSLAIYLKIGKMARLEFLITAGMFLAIALVFFLGMEQGPNKIFDRPMVNPLLILLPFGPVLFSLSGRSAIPAVIEYSNGKETLKKINRVIGIGSAMPAAVYLLFTVGMIGLLETTTSDSIKGITSMPRMMAMIVSVFGILSIMSSYIVVGLSIKQIAEDDLQFSKVFSFAAAVAAPMILLYAGLNNFFQTVTIAGGVFLAAESIIIILIWQKLNKTGVPARLFEKKMPPAAVNLLTGIFILGIIYTLVAGF